MVSFVASPDGTVVGFESTGQGPAMVLVHGGTADRGRWAPVRARLAERFGVHALDRRGRGLSTAEVGPYNIRREGEDIAAVVEAVGHDVYVVAHSYGALCALEAALLTDAIGRMILYEPPLPTGDLHVVAPCVVDGLRTAAAAGHSEEVLERFFRQVIQLSPAEISAMRSTPLWRARLAAASTIVRELEAIRCFETSERLSKIEIPVRLLLGTRSPAYFRPAAEAIAASVPNADLLPLDGQDHMGIDRDPEQFTAAVMDFAFPHERRHR